MNCYAMTSRITHGRWLNVGISGWPNVILAGGGNVGSPVGLSGENDVGPTTPSDVGPTLAEIGAAIWVLVHRKNNK